MIDHIQKSQAVGFNMAGVLPDFGVCRFGKDAAGRLEDQRERGSEFMGNIAEKIGFQLFHCFHPLSFTVFVCQLFFHLHPVDLKTPGLPYRKNQQQGIGEICEAGTPPGRVDHDSHFYGRIIPDPHAVAALHPEYVCAWRQVRKVRKMIHARRVPVLFNGQELVPVLIFFRIRKIHG